MKKKKRILCMILSLVMCFSLSAGAFAQDCTQENTQEDVYATCQNVFVHGLCGWGQYSGVNDIVNYWGGTSGNMMEYLSEKGYSVCSATCGPISSCWDRCCELFAQLTGTVTDYGAAHVDKTLAQFEEDGCTLNHERYGRDYDGRALVENWGPVYDEYGNPTGEWYDSQINLIGHSFGGPTIVKFLQLLAEGDADERAYAEQEAEIYGGSWKDYCSPLFWGDYDGENLVNSLTTLAGVLNGTTFIDSCDDTTELVMDFMVMIANIIGETDFNELYDFQLEQFGITSSENPNYEYTLDLLRASSFFDSRDNVIYDLSVEGCNELKQGWNCYENVFYFAYPGSTTYYSNVTGTHLPESNTWSPLVPFAAFMGAYVNEDEIVTDINGEPFTTITEEWLENDGMVNTISASYVFGCDHKSYDGVVEPGLWITMSPYGYDHMDFIGGLVSVTQTTEKTEAFFDEVMRNINATYYYVEKLATPELTVSNIKYTSFIKLSWNPVENATGYKIYRSSSPNGAYSLIRTTNQTSFRDVCAALGRTYYYRISAVNASDPSITSDFSEVKSIRNTLR